MWASGPGELEAWVSWMRALLYSQDAEEMHAVARVCDLEFGLGLFCRHQQKVSKMRQTRTGLTYSHLIPFASSRVNLLPMSPHMLVSTNMPCHW